MKKILCSILVGIAANVSLAGNADYLDSKFVFEEIKTFKINKEEPRAFFISYPNYELASKWTSVDDIENIYNTPNYQLLNGDWKFLFLEHEKLFKPEYISAKFDDSKWDILDVPNTWQAKGYDRIFYRNHPAEFQFHKDGSRIKGYEDGGKNNPSEAILNPRIPDDHREVGVYRREFNLSKDWSNKEVFIRFNGVRTGYKVFVNGKFAGYAEDSFTPSEFNITSLLKAGKNSLAVQVFKYSTGGYFEMQDMPHMSGIIRDLMLIARPKVYIRDYYAPVHISDDLKSAKIKFDAWVKNLSKDAVSNLVLKVDIIDEKGEKLNSKSLFEKSISQIPISKEVKVSEEVDVKDFKLWSPDKPNLYAILISLFDANGNVLETVKADFGFKKFIVKGTGIFLNNKPVLFKGVNRHDWSPDKGKTCTFKWQKMDVELMKEVNINSVRTSHYPNEDTFYMLCSRYGIMVLDEANVEQHGFSQTMPLNFDHFIPAGVDRMKNMVFRDRNIPSVIIFSVGNESAWGPDVKGFIEMGQVVRKYSSLHYVHYEMEANEKIRGEDGGISDFASPMYGGVSKMNSYLRAAKKYPFFFCEYAHSMGNAIGNLKGKWDLIRANSDCLHGGFIWDWVDQALYMSREDDPTKLFLSDGRDWKTQPSANNFSSNGIIRADRTHFAKFYEVKRIYQDIQLEQISAENPKKVKISNEFFDTNLNEFDGEILVLRDGEVVHKKKLNAIDLPAGKTIEMEFDLPEFKEEGEYFYSVNFKSKASNKVVSHTQFNLKNTTTFKELKAPSGKIEVSKDDETATVKAGKYVYEFDVKVAELKSLKRGKDVIINSPVKFDISTAFIDNERGAEVGRELRGRTDKLKEIDADLKIEKLKGNAVRVIASKILANKDGEGFANEFVYTILADGTMQVVASCQKINETPNDLRVPRIGLKMGLTPSIENVEFYGRGDFANYSDRKTAADIGRYALKVKDFMEEYSWPQDTGNREDVRWLRVFDTNGNGVKILAQENPLPMALLPYTQDELSSAKHPHNLKAPVQNELRIAWQVRGIGNSSCGPSTRGEFRPSFNGKVSWSFIFKPFTMKAKDLSLSKSKSYLPKQESPVVFPAELSYTPKADDKNLPVEKLVLQPVGKWISENAKVTYSSKDERWSPKKDNLLTTGEGDFSFHTNIEEKPYLIVKLEKTEEITSVEILNRADHAANRASRLRMLVSENGTSWKQVWGNDETKSRWVVVFEKPVKAKFVKLMLDKKEIFHLKRVRIFAK